MNEKKIFIISLIVAIFSTVLFLPSCREFILCLGEIIIGRSLTHSVWNYRFVMWEIDFLIFWVTLSFVFYSYNHISCAVSGKILKIFSWGIPVFFSLCLLFFASISSDVWLDETFSLGIAHHKVKELIDLTAKDVHPPLYYLLLKPAMFLMPNSIFFARIISVIPIILILVASTCFLKREYSFLHCIVFDILLFSLHPVVHYALEIRSYSWSLFFSTMCFIFSYYIVLKDEWKYWLLYIFFAELAVWCNYITGFGIALNFFYICLLVFIKHKNSFLKIFISSLVGIFLFLPWAIVLLHHSSSVKIAFSVGMPFSLRDFLNFNLFIVPGNGLFLFFVIMLLFFIIKIIFSFHSGDKILAAFYLITILTPFSLILFASVISIFTKPYFSRYAFPLYVFIPMFFVMTFKELKINRYLLALLISIGVVSSFSSFMKSYKFEREMAVENKKFELVMEKYLTEDTVFVYSPAVSHHIPHVLAYRWPNNKMFGFKISPLWADVYSYDIDNCIDSLNGQKDLCFVMNQDELPNNNYFLSNSNFFLVRISHMPAVKLYFIKK